MKHFRLLLIAGTSTSVALSGLLVACSGDDTIVSGDAGTDAPITPTDSGTDTATEEPKDTGADHANFDAGLSPENYVQLAAATLCGSLARCCYGNTDPPDGSVDGGSFDKARCQSIQSTLGFELSSVGASAIVQGKVALDQFEGDQCLQKIKAMSCSLTGAELQTIRAACFGALKGTLTAGQDCRGSIECASGNFCNAVDGGAPAKPDSGMPPIIGACAPLRTQGQNCSVFNTADIDDDAVNSEEACSYRSSGTPKLHCNSYDFVADDYRARANWTCEPLVANGQRCNSTVWCADGICDPTNQEYVCKSPLDYFKLDCPAFVK